MATRFMGTCNCWHDLVFFLGVGLLNVRIFSLYSHNGNWPSVSSITICDGILFSELGFFEMFLCSTSWAIALYFKQRWSKDEVEDFSSLADHHKEWAQVWFSISISIFLGGLTYAIFHVAESSFLQCSVPVSVYDKAAANERELTALAQELLRNVKDGADEKELIALAKNIVEKAVANKPVADKVEWTALAEKLLPNIFIYSLFFAAWKWSSTHFRAHWHDFTTNAYRHRALVKFGQLEKLDDEVHFGDIRRLSGMLLLLLSDSAYTEESNEITGTERIIKLEEMIRELFTTKQ